MKFKHLALCAGLLAGLLTSPLWAATELAIKATIQPDAGGNLVIHWPGQSGVRYHIESSPDLSAWTVVPGEFAGTGGELTSTVRTPASPAADRQFWRVTTVSAGFTEAAPVYGRGAEWGKLFDVPMAIVAKDGTLTQMTHRYTLKGPLTESHPDPWTTVWSSPYNADQANSYRTTAYPLVVYLHPSGVKNSEEWYTWFWGTGASADERQIATDTGYINMSYGVGTYGPQDPKYFVYTPMVPPPCTEAGGPSARDGGEWNSPAAKQMITTTIKDLLRRFNIDPARIYIIGGSMGGAGVRYIAQEWYNQTHSPFAAIVADAGFTPNTAMLGYAYDNVMDPNTGQQVMVYRHNPDGSLVYQAQSNQFPDLYRSAFWYGSGELDIEMAEYWYSNPLDYNLPLAKTTYAWLKMQTPGGTESTATHTIAEAYPYPAMSWAITDYKVAGKSRYRLSVGLGMGHGINMNRDPDFVNWLFSQHN